MFPGRTVLSPNSQVPERSLVAPPPSFSPSRYPWGPASVLPALLRASHLWASPGLAPWPDPLWKFSSSFPQLPVKLSLSLFSASGGGLNTSTDLHLCAKAQIAGLFNRPWQENLIFRRRAFKFQ